MTAAPPRYGVGARVALVADRPVVERAAGAATRIASGVAQ